MKRILLIPQLSFVILCLQVVLVNAQVMILHENFEDRDLTTQPAWSGNLNDFNFEEENGNTLLRLAADPERSRTQIITPGSTVSGSWEFYFRQEFSPSNLNRAFIFLMADRNDLNYLDGSSVNGYAVRTGDNQSPRKLKLVRFDDGNQTVLAESEIELVEGGGYKVQVIRSEDAQWQLLMSEGYDSIPEIQAGPLLDDRHDDSSYIGLLLRYSSGNIDNFYFDDLIIKSFDPFRLVDAEVIQADKIALTFNYPVAPESVTPQSVLFTDLPEPLSAKTDPSGRIALFTFSEIIENGEYTVTAEGIRSTTGDSVPDGSETKFYFTNPFRVTDSEITGPRSIEIQFSLSLSNASATSGNFTINESLRPSRVEQAPPGTLTLEFNSELPSGLIRVNMGNLESEEGWRIRKGTSISTFRFGDAKKGDLVINEILYRREATGQPEFVEIYNRRDHVFKLDGWMLQTERGQANIGQGVVIREQDFLVFTDERTFATADERIIYLPDFQSLRNTGDAVTLRNQNGVSVDSLFYSPDWGSNTPGVSLERKDPGAISLDPVNWSESTADAGSSPLLQNSRFHPDETAPEVVFAGFQSESEKILVRFSEFVDPGFETLYFLNDQAVTTLNTGEVPGNELFFKSVELKANSDLIFRAEKISDFQGNVLLYDEIPVSRPAEPGDLVFNEVMFDPLKDNYDQLPDQTEYLEIVNRRNHAISLEGMYIHDRPDENGSVNVMEPEVSRSGWIPAGGIALLQADDSGKKFRDSRNARFFGLGEELIPHLLLFDRSTLSLPMAGREVYLADRLGRIIDMVDYRPEWHNPNLIDTKGISLERVNPNGETNDPANWGSNTTAEGGSPGKENSLYQVPADVLAKNSISLEPNPFSPDGNGYEDNLFINYNFEDPNFMLRVRIFDRYGRLVRNLADSYPSGYDGALIWDGRMDNDVTCRIGIYIIHIEAYNSATGERREFKETAVLARQF